MTTDTHPLDDNMSLQEGEVLVNSFDDEVPTTQEEVSLPEEVEVNASDEQEDDLSDLDPKYSKKNIREVVQMHQELEKLLGKQGDELGRLRPIVDDFIQTRNQEVKQEVKEPEDFFEDPLKAVDQRIKDNPDLAEIKQLLLKQQQQESLGRVASKHPNYIETIKDPNFVEWIKASEVRKELLQRADNYDFNSADELLSTWQERTAQVDKVKEVNESDRKKQLKSASTGGKGSGEPISRKIYKRSTIVNLMRTDPDKYMANIEEIQKAYEEGRVR